jgi:hypothetical protein
MTNIALIETPSSPATAGSPVGRWARVVLLVIPVIVVGVFLTATFAYVAISSLPTRWPVTYPEGAQVAAILRLRSGEPLYPEFLAFPYVIAPYPPVLYLIGAGLSGLLSLSVYETTVAARAVTLVASFATALLVGLLALREGAGRLAAAAAATLLLPIPLLDQWGFAVRPDIPAILLSLAAGWVLLSSPRHAWLAGTLVGLALLTKFTALSMPAVAVLWLVATRRYREAVIFGTTAAGVFAVGAGVTLAASDGEAFGHTVIANMNPLLPIDHAARVFTRLPAVAWFPFAVAAVGLVLQVRARRLRLSGAYLLATLAVGLVTLRGRGGDVNYLIEAAAATCWLAAHGFASVWSSVRQWRLRYLPGAAIVVAASVIWGIQTFNYWRKDGGVATDRRLPLDEIAATEWVLAEEPTMVVLADRPLLVSDPFNLSQLQTAGRFDTTELVQRVRRHEFGLVVLRGDVRQTRYINGQPKWPESVRRAIADYYVFSKRVDLYWLYVPDRPGR